MKLPRKYVPPFERYPLGNPGQTEAQRAGAFGLLTFAARCTVPG